MKEKTTAVMTQTEQLPDLSDAQDMDNVETDKYLIVVSDELKLGIDATLVVEIINNLSITYLPMMPDYVQGIINLRGQIIPILDIRARLGKEQLPESLVVVLNLDGGIIGVQVDAVDQMIDIPRDSILPMPPHNAQQLVSGMCSLPDESGTMMVLACDQLLRHDG
jgi:purine-binding chemotaxis protein CheW